MEKITLRPPHNCSLNLAFTLGFFLVGNISAATILFQDDFNDGDLSIPSPTWGGGPYNGGGNTNLATGEITSEEIMPGDSAIQLRTNFPSTPDVGFLGGQLSKSLGATIFDGYAAGDIQISFDLSVLSDKVFTDVPTGITVEIRESGRAGGSNGTTHRFRAVPIDLNGTFSNYSFTLDTKTFGTFPTTPFGAGNKQIYFQVQSGYATENIPTQTDLRLDNLMIVAVPEPSTAMLCLATIGLLLRRRR